MRTYIPVFIRTNLRIFNTYSQFNDMVKDAIIVAMPPFFHLCKTKYGITLYIYVSVQSQFLFQN